MVIASLVSPVAFLCGLQMFTFLLCSHIPFPLCLQTPGVSSSDYKDTSHISLGPCLYHIINFNYLFKGPIYKYCPIGG